jgi:predicted metal-dependent hydrolase
MQVSHITIGRFRIDVIQKNIKNVHLSVHPPMGKISVSAPAYMELDTIRLFAISKLDWIKSKQKRILAQEREAPREYLNRESHYVWGKRYLLALREADIASSIELKHRTLIITLRTTAVSSAEARRHVLLECWYRQQIRLALPALIAKWEPLIGVKAQRIFVQRMKTKWGSCNPASGSIRLNTDLAKKPPQCLEYIVVHELVHLIEPTHNARFLALMERFMPNWKHLKDELNRLPVRHESWTH